MGKPSSALRYYRLPALVVVAVVLLITLLGNRGIVSAQTIGPVVGALMALSGVVFVQVSERFRADEKRAYEAKKASLEKLIEAIARARGYLSNIPSTPDLKDGLPRELADLGPALYQIHCYCDVETIKATLQFGHVLNVTFGKAIAARIEADKFQIEIAVRERAITGAEQRMVRLDEERFAYLREDPNHKLLETVGKGIANLQSEIDRRRLELGPLYVRQNDARAVCRDILANEMLPLAESITAVFVNARRELGFNIEDEDYAKVVLAAERASIALLNEFKRDVRARTQND